MDSNFNSFVQEVRENFEDLSYDLAELQEQLNQLNASVIILLTQQGLNPEQLKEEVSNE
tara:strand:+ start:1084 stop:1260 length:177 start_codon:yes stop_codon:yes gene_type:complete